MNLRILKKLSKRAAPLLVALGDRREQFPNDRWEGHTSSTGHERKHWERRRARYPMERRGDIHVKPRNGEGMIVLSQEYMHPWKGTIMLGWTFGHETPEWEEDDAWTLLAREVRSHWEEFREIPGTEDEMGCPEHEWVIHRRFRNPSAILRAVPELIEVRRKEQEEWQARRAAVLCSKEAA